MNISSLVAYALKAAGQPAPLMTTQQSLQALSTLFDSGATWRNLTTSGAVPSAIAIGLSAVGPRAWKLADIPPSGRPAGTCLTISASDVDPDSFGRCVAPILSWCVQETVAGRLSIDDLDQAVDTMVQTDPASQRIWKPTVPTDPILKASFASYLTATGFVSAFSIALGVVRGAAAAIGDTLSAGAYVSVLNAASTTLSWVSMKAPFDLLIDKYAEFVAKRASTIDTLKKLKSLADSGGVNVTADEKAQIQALYDQFAGIDAQSQPVLSKVGLWQNMAALNGLGAYGLGALAVLESVGATVALAVVGALVLLIGMYTALQLNASSKADALQNAILSRADALKASGAISTDEYTSMIGSAVKAGQAVRESAGGGSFFSGIAKSTGMLALLGVVIVGGYMYAKSAKSKA